MGAKKRPFYRVIVADARAPRDGRFIDTLGTYNPLTDPAAVKLDAEKVRLWLSRGAQPSDPVKHLLAREGFLRS
jgi:small subunit ribosomal protein S16